jgi:hypothetical protein
MALANNPQTVQMTSWYEPIVEQIEAYYLSDLDLEQLLEEIYHLFCSKFGCLVLGTTKDKQEWIAKIESAFEGVAHAAGGSR